MIRKHVRHVKYVMDHRLVEYMSLTYMQVAKRDNNNKTSSFTSFTRLSRENDLNVGRQKLQKLQFL